MTQHGRGSTLPQPATGEGPPTTSHRGAMGEEDPCHVPPQGHGRGGTLPHPTLGPPATSHRALLGSALARGSRRCLTLRRVPQSEQPAHRHPTAVMWVAASSTCGKEKAAGGRRGGARSIPLSLLRRPARKDAVQTAVLTVMPPPQTPGMALACLLMCPSARYFDAPPGKSRRMLAATESVPSASRQGPTIRLHFPTHMATLHGDGEEEEERKGLPSAPRCPTAPPTPSPSHSHGWTGVCWFVLLGPSLPHRRCPCSRAISNGNPIFPTPSN